MARLADPVPVPVPVKRFLMVRGASLQEEVAYDDADDSCDWGL